MALTARERKRRQIEREKNALGQLPDSTYPYLKDPFFQHLEDDPNWSSVTLCFELLGIKAPEFMDDRGPDQFAFESCFSTDEDRAQAFTGTQNSIGRAEVMVGALLDAATELASIINSFKQRELARRLKEIEADSLAEPAERKAALAAAMHISKLQEELGKNVRRTLPQWQVKGV